MGTTTKPSVYGVLALCTFTSLANALPANGSVVSTVEVSAGFVRNEGQWDEPVRFGAIGGTYLVRVLDDGFELARPSEMCGEAEVVSYRFAAQAPEMVPPQGLDVRRDRHHFFFGNDPSQWRRDVAAFDRVRFESVADGIDLVLTMQRGRLHYDLIVEPGANPSAFALNCDGDFELSKTADGAAESWTRTGRLRHSRPVAYELFPDGGRREVPVRLELIGSERMSFSFASHDAIGERVIDPGIEWSTFLGGATPGPGVHLNTPAPTVLEEAIVRSDGTVVVAGYTGRIDFPMTENSFDDTYGGSVADGVISVLNSTGSELIYSTYLGGVLYDGVKTIDTKSDGSLIATGTTNSIDFPLTPGGPFGGGRGGAPTGVSVTRFGPTGDILEYSIIVPATSPQVFDANLTPNGDVLIVGLTSAGFPTTPGAYDESINGGADGFVLRMNGSGTAIVFSTYLGGTETDSFSKVLVSQDESVIVAGTSFGSGYPTTPSAFQKMKNSTSADGVVSRISADGKVLVFSTFLGGVGQDIMAGAAIDSAGRVTVVGHSSSVNFPTSPGAFQDDGEIIPGAVVARLSADLSTLVFGTFFGGIGVDQARSCALDPAGNVVFNGFTFSDFLMGFPTTKGAWKEEFVHEPSDGFVAYLTKDGKSLLYSTLIGGTDADFSGSYSQIGLALDATGAATICGVVGSPDYPVTPGAFDTFWPPDLGKGVVTRLDLLPKGVTKFGSSTPGCNGPLAIGVDSMPYVGNTSFGLRCVGAPPHAWGWLLISSLPLPSGLSAAGIKLFVDPSTSAVVPVFADADGEVRIRQALTPQGPPIGLRAYAQFIFRDGCGPSGVAASNALEIEVQAP